MKLIKKKDQYRRDFTGIYECESCGNRETHNYCYDDRNFHDNVTPAWKCKACGKSTLDLGSTVEHTPTKYSDDQVV